MVEMQKSIATIESREGGKIKELRESLPELAVQAKELKKIYLQGKNQLEALKGIQLEIKTGEILAIMGPSGAGKSTLLHILGLMESATSGNLTLLGWETEKISETEKNLLRNKYIGFVFQFHYLISELSVLENVALPARILGEPKKEAEEKAVELLESIGLTERMHHFPSEISGGEQQRTALARALVNHPAILLCDEPTGNLDLEKGEEVRELIWRTARARHCTVSIATHNIDIAKKADRIIRIVDGKIVNSSP